MAMACLIASPVAASNLLTEHASLELCLTVRAQNLASRSCAGPDDIIDASLGACNDAREAFVKEASKANPSLNRGALLDRIRLNVREPLMNIIIETQAQRGC